METHRFSSGPHELAFYEVSPDTPRDDALPIVLVHGFASNARVNWIDTGWFKALLADGRRVIALDNLGHGRSATPHDSAFYTTEAMAGDVAALMDHLGLRRADVMGYSMGARITARLALDRPERVRRAVLSGLGSTMIDGLSGSARIAQALEADTLEEVSDPVGRPFRLFADQTGSDRLALAACIKASRARIPADEIARMSVPVLIAVGTKDEVAGTAEGLARHIPHARTLDIPNRDHMRAVGDTVHKRGVLDYLNDTQNDTTV